MMFGFDEYCIESLSNIDRTEHRFRFPNGYGAIVRRGKMIVCEPDRWEVLAVRYTDEPSPLVWHFELNRTNEEVAALLRHILEKERAM